jgi:hypothetical protein
MGPDELLTTENNARRFPDAFTDRFQQSADASNIINGDIVLPSSTNEFDLREKLVGFGCQKPTAETLHPAHAIHHAGRTVGVLTGMAEFAQVASD